MESVVEDVRGTGQEAMGSPRRGTSAQRGASDETAMDSGLLPPSTGEKLTNEVVNTGTRGTAAHCQPSHDRSSSSDTTQGIPHATLTGDLVVSRSALETATKEKHAADETRPLTEENMCLKEPETSSDDTDDWETASEKSLALDLEPHDPYRVRMETGSYSQERYNEDAGLHGAKTISEDAGAYGHETLSINTGQETMSEDAGPHGQKPVNEVDELCGLESVVAHEMLRQHAGPHGEEVNGESAEAHGHDDICEDARTHGHETVGRIAEGNSHETVIEEPELHEMVSTDAGPHGPEPVNEVDELHGLESASKKTAEPLAHDDVETNNREASVHSLERSDDTGSYAQETVNKEEEPRGQEMINEETASYCEGKTEIVTDSTNCDEETDVELVGPVYNETASDMTWPPGSAVELQVNETVSGVDSEEFDKDCKISPIVVLDWTANENIVTVNEETSDDEKTFSPDENKKRDSEEILETHIDDIKSNSKHDEEVSKGTFVDGTFRSHFETQDVSKETFSEDTQLVYMERDNEKGQEVYKGMANHEIQGIYKQTVGENALQETPDFEDTEVVDTGMVETTKRMEKVRNEERIVNEQSSEEREMTTNVPMKCNEGAECNDVFSEDSKVLDEGPTDEDDDKQRWDLALTVSDYKLAEAIEITDLEYERLVETFEGLLEDLPNIMSQKPVLESQLSAPVTIDDSSSMDCTMDIEAQMDVSGPQLMEEEGQLDYAETWSKIETNCIESYDRRSTDTQNEPSKTLGFGYNAEPEVRVVSSDGQEIGGPCLQLSVLHTGDCRSSDDPNIAVQHQGLDDPKPLLEETIIVEMLDPPHRPLCSQVDQEASSDEPDHHKLDFFPITLKGPSVVVPPHDFLPESINTECIASQGSTQESSQQERPLDDTDPATCFEQNLTPGSDTAKTTTINSENVKLFRRQRSNTYPGRSQVQEEKLQASSNTEGSSRGRVRSITPPYDKFTSTSASTPPKTLEPFTTSLLFPSTDEDNSHKGEATSVTPYVFRPTQIFNPMLLLGHAEEESGFYQAETFSCNSMENASQRPLPSPPQDNWVLQHTQNPEIIAVEPNTLPKSAVDAIPTSAPSVAPVWLPPQRTRYIGDPSGATEIRTMKPPETSLVRRATIRHRRSNAGARPMDKRFSNTNLPSIPQQEYVARPSTRNLPRIQSVNVGRIEISARNRPLAQQVGSEEAGQARSLPAMATVREEGQPANRPESVLLRGTRRGVKPPPSHAPQSIQRRYSTLINSSNLLYQEYSDVALNEEIQRQKPGDSPAEDSLPGSPRVRRRILSSQVSYLQRLSISSADSLWQDIPKIRDSVTFLSMTREEQKLQEAKFELIMSEALYLRSLNIAVDHFQRSAELQEVLSAQDRQWLFSRLSEVRDASSDFLFDLEEEFESNMYKFQVCDVLTVHEPTFRRVYLPYVMNQSYQDRTFQRLMSENPRFQQVLSRLESDAVCQRLSLKSFLILPFQRITRLRLLLQNILKRSAPGSAEELQATEAHSAVEKLIRDCNESVQRMKDTEELILLNQKIQFECKIFPLISQSRRLVKHGEVTTLEFSSTSFKSKITTRPVYLHLFNDCLLLSRVREGGRFVVFDHASEVRVEGCEIKLHNNQKNIFRIFLRDSAATGRETEYIFRTETQSQKLRWICALSSSKEKIDFWRDHGLSQMQCLKSYKARENDELSLEKADILMITQNSDDGWLYGIRLSDQQSGWFPQSNVQPISRNACLRNLQEEQRLQTARAKLQPTGPQGR